MPGSTLAAVSCRYFLFGARAVKQLLVADGHTLRSDRAAFGSRSVRAMPAPFRRHVPPVIAAVPTSSPPLDFVPRGMPLQGASALQRHSPWKSPRFTAMNSAQRQTPKTKGGST